MWSTTCRSTSSIARCGQRWGMIDAEPLPVAPDKRAAMHTPPSSRGSSPGPIGVGAWREPARRSEEHTSELQSLMRNSYAVFCLQKKKDRRPTTNSINILKLTPHKLESNHKLL